MAKDAQRESDFKWETIGGSSGASQSQQKPTDEKKDAKGGFATGEKKNAFSKEGIQFSKGRPTFHKSEHVGNKGEFPELGGDVKKEVHVKPSGPIEKSVSAPTKPTFKP